MKKSTMSDLQAQYILMSNAERYREMNRLTAVIKRHTMRAVESHDPSWMTAAKRHNESLQVLLDVIADYAVPRPKFDYVQHQIDVMRGK